MDFLTRFVRRGVSSSVGEWDAVLPGRLWAGQAPIGNRRHDPPKWRYFEGRRITTAVRYV
jgi:hypothetical protein